MPLRPNAPAALVERQLSVGSIQGSKFLETFAIDMQR